MYAAENCSPTAATIEIFRRSAPAARVTAVARIQSVTVIVVLRDRAGLPALSLGHVNLLGVALIVPATLLTTGWGVRAAHAVNPGTLKRLFALFLALTSARMLWNLAS